MQYKVCVDISNVKRREGEYRTAYIVRVTAVRTVHDLLMIFIYGGLSRNALVPMHTVVKLTMNLIKRS